MTINIDRERTLAVLQQLIRLRTVPPGWDEKDLVRYVVSLFPKGTLEIDIIDHGSNRASLVAVLPGENRRRRLAFAGHSDTLAVFHEEDWDYSPFGAHYHDGFVYGRGSSSMKGGIAAMVMAMLYFVERGETPPSDVILCLCADGDSAHFTGAKAIARGGFLEGVQEIIFAEPTEQQIGIAQRGGIWLRVHAKGRSCYACRSELGINALEKIIEFYKMLTDRLVNSVSKRDEHPFFGKPTCTLTTLNAESQSFLIPDCASGEIDIRVLPGQDSEEVVSLIRRTGEEMERSVPGLVMNITVTNNRHSIGMAPDSPMIKRFESVLCDMKKPVKKAGLFYMTDASILVPPLGVPFLFFGPGEDVYTCLKNERISIDSVVDTAEVFVRYIKKSGGQEQ